MPLRVDRPAEAGEGSRYPWCWAALLGLLSVSLAAQTTPGPRFEVTSVKPTKVTRGTSQLTDSGYATSSALVRTAIAFAYGTQSFLVVDGDNWMSEERFDIRGTFPTLAPNHSKPNREQLLEMAQAMMRTLLAERFALRVREERRTLPMFVLSIKDARRKDAPLPGNPACDTLRADILSGRVIPRTAADPPSARPIQMNCGIRRSPKGNLFGVSSDGADMKEFAALLMAFLGRYVDDQTGIKGSIRLNTTFGADQVPSRRALSASPSGTTGPTIGDALAREMNLSLRADRRPVPVIAVEHVEHPTSN